MAKFRYRMQNILNIKEKLEAQEKQNFAAMRLKLTEEENKLEELKQRRDLVANEGKQLRNEHIDILKIKENSALIAYLDESIKSQLLKVKAAEKNLENARAKMQTAIQERQIHEKLRENALNEFLREENAAELKEVDELTSYRFSERK